MQDDFEFATIDEACVEIGGKARPVNRATYYRGVKRGIYPKPIHPSPGIARVHMPSLRDALRF